MRKEWRIKREKINFRGECYYSVISPKGKVKFLAWDHDGAVSMCEALNSFERMGKGEVEE